LNDFIEKHGFDCMKYKAVATNGRAAMQSTTNGVVRKLKNASIDCVSTCFFGDLSVTDRSFLKLLKNLGQFGQNIFSDIQKCPN